MLPWDRRDWILAKVDEYIFYDNPAAVDALKKTRSFVRMGLATLLNDDERKAVMGWLLRENHQPIGTKDLRGSEVMALQAWINAAYSKDDGEFLVSAEFREEIRWIVKEMQNYGRQSKQGISFGLE